MSRKIFLAPTKEERAEAQAKVKSAVEERKQLAEKRDARRQAVLAADAEYQSLYAAYKFQAEEAQRLMSTA